MAWATGTASNHRDLMAKIRDFLTANADLVALGQQWVQLAGPTTGTPDGNDEFVFQGPGLAGDDEVIVSMTVFEDTGLGYYALYGRGMTGYNPDLPINEQPGAGPVGARLLLANLALTYWIIANGRCFKVIAKVGSVYDQCYMGLILPEHMPADWPYPLFVGGCSDTVSRDNGDVSDYRRAFWNSHERANAHLLNAGLAWRSVGNWYSSNDNDTSDYVSTIPWNSVFYNQKVRGTLDDQPVLTPGGLVTSQETDSDNGIFYGRFDGVFHVTAFETLAEQTITIAGKDYLVVPDIFRTSDGHMAAYALE